MTPLDAAWSALLASPDDDAALRVLGDALLDAGDPHGELIQLQLAPDVDRELVDRHVATHAARLLGDERRLLAWSLSFARGFVFAAGPLIEPAELDALLGLPIAKLLRRLRLEEVSPQLVERLLAHAPAALEELWLVGAASTRQPGAESTGQPIAPLLATLPHLETLLLQGLRPDFTDARSARLELLFLDAQAGVRGLESARLEALRELTVTLPFRQLELPLALLAGEVTPKLRHLSVGGALWPTQLQELAGSALLRQLEVLTLSVGPETGWYPVLLQNPERFAHLQRIHLRRDRHHPDWVATLKELLPRVHYVGMS
ncbi:MAG: hypothetical protein ACOZQL_22175 [Myxococcota bacterium]